MRQFISRSNEKAFARAVATIAIAGSASAALGSDRVVIGTFAIDGTEVTIGAFRKFVEARKLKTTAELAGGGNEYSGGWTKRPGWTWATPYGSPAANDEPAVHVSWFEARDYCAFVGGRLPTSAEWRLAAYTETRPTPTDGFVSGKTYSYPVGDSPEGMNNNRRSHVAAGSTKRGVNGLYDMGANVWEWNSDRRGEDALTAGGSWWYGPENARADAAQWKPAAFHAVYVGFRCAYELVR